MNLTQCLMVLVPVVLAYGYFVLTAKSDGRVNRWANLFAGLIVVPLFLGFLPLLLFGASLDLLRKHQWGEGLITLSFLVLLVGYGAIVIHLRDPMPPSVWDLPVEQPLEKPVDLPVEKPLDR